MKTALPYPLNMIRKKGIKRLKLIITKEPNGGVLLRVNLPFGVSKAHALAFVDENREWINKQVARLKKEQQNVEDFLHLHAGELPIFGQWERYDSCAHTKRKLKARLTDYLAGSIARYGAAMGIAPKSFHIRKNRYRLGSCRLDGTLTFSLQLLFAPPEVVDYVVAHELAHIIHHNHSAQFWELLACYYPKHKEEKAYLRANHALFVRLLERFF
ncbi:MAG: M48 family metallopeptidase [Wolinella sp.]